MQITILNVDSLQTLETLQLGYTGLTVFPPFPSNIHATMKSLNIDNNRGLNGEIPEAELAKFANLLTLSIAYVELTEFLNMTELGEDFTSRLRTLSIGGNSGLETVPDGILGQFVNLAALYMHSLGLTTIPDNNLLPSMTRLYLNNNDYGNVNGNNKAFLDNIKYLYLVNCGLTTLSGISGANLKEIQLQRNNFITITPEDLKGFPMLETIRLESLHLTEFPDFRILNATLTKIFIGDNEISCIRSEIIQELQTLTHLYLNGNNLQTLPNLFLGPPALYHLDISNNQFQQFPTVGKYVHTVDMSGNAVRQVHASHVQGSNIANLYLSDNALTYVSDLTGSGLQNLWVDGNGGLDLCACHHVWMVAAQDYGLTLDVTDVVCPGLGFPWSHENTTTKTLGNDCVQGN